jgi:hypothetical protein
MQVLVLTRDAITGEEVVRVALVQPEAGSAQAQRLFDGACRFIRRPAIAPEFTEVVLVRTGCNHDFAIGEVKATFGHAEQ